MNWKDKGLKRLVLLVLAFVFVLFKWDSLWKFIFKVLQSMKSLLYGLVLAYIVNIVYAHFLKRKLPKSLALFLAYVLIVLAIFALSVVILPELYTSISNFIQRLPSSLENLSQSPFLQKYAPMVVKQLESVNWENYVNSLLRFLQSQVQNVANGTLNIMNQLVSGLSSGLIAIIFSIYVLTSKSEIKKTIQRARRLFSTGTQEKMDQLYRIVHQNFYNFVVGQLLEATILASLCAFGMIVFSFPYPLAVGILVGFINIIPIAGAYIGGIVGAFMVYTVHPSKFWWFVLFLIVLQQVESNLIYPRVVGGKIGLPPIWVFVSVVIMGSLFGIVGMLVGIPLAASIYQYVEEYC